MSHQRSPLVLQGCQRAKRPCSCANKSLGNRLQSVLGARSGFAKKNPISSSISKVLKNSWLLGGPDPKTRFEACERAGGSKSTKTRDPEAALCFLSMAPNGEFLKIRGVFGE